MPDPPAAPKRQLSVVYQDLPAAEPTDDGASSTYEGTEKLLPSSAPRSDTNEAARVTGADAGQELARKRPDKTDTVTIAIGPTGRVLGAAFLANTCCSALAGALFVLVFLCSSDPSATQSIASAPPSPAADSAVSRCAAYSANAGLFEGLLDRADGGTDEGDETAALAIDNPFATTFFDFDCLRTGGTGDPCDAHVAEAYALF